MQLDIHPKTHFLIIFFLVVLGALFVTLNSPEPPAAPLPAKSDNIRTVQEQSPPSAQISNWIRSLFSWFGLSNNEPKKETAPANFACENNQTNINSRGYVLLMGYADHHKEGWDVEKNLMEQDPKASFVKIYDQNEKNHIGQISEQFLTDIHGWLRQYPVDELVLLGSSAGGVTASYSIARLHFKGPVALHTMASPIKGYDLTGFRSLFIGDRKGYLRDIAIGFKPFETPGKNVKVYHHKTVTDSILKGYCGAYASFCDVKEIQNNNIKGSKEFYYPEHDHTTIMGAVVRDVLKCYNPEIKKVIDEEQLSLHSLGTLCRGEEACDIFCKNNYGQCKNYCKSDPHNAICRKGFSFEDNKK